MKKKLLLLFKLIFKSLFWFFIKYVDLTFVSFYIVLIDIIIYNFVGQYIGLLCCIHCCGWSFHFWINVWFDSLSLQLSDFCFHEFIFDVKVKVNELKKRDFMYVCLLAYVILLFTYMYIYYIYCFFFQIHSI